MDLRDISKAQGHWILAYMGKRVLRPGGKELTQKLLTELKVSAQDKVVEFAPGTGYTASFTLAANPKNYIGIDADADIIRRLKKKFETSKAEFILCNAADTPLMNESADKVYAEAMLTMHADSYKSAIIHETYRILKKGGIYAIHELGLMDVDGKLKTEIHKDFAMAIKVNAKPLTADEWKALLEKEGFIIKETYITDMLLLERKRIIDDEGIMRALKIGWKILTHSAARKRILGMRKVFRKHQKHINAIAIIAEKV